MTTSSPVRLHLHVGVRRSGATALQRQLVAARDPLLSAGVYVPAFPATPQPWNNLAWELSGDRRFRPRVSNWSALLEDAAAHGARHLLVSSQELGTVLRRPKAAQRFRELAELAGGGTQLVAVLRDHASLLNSVYAARAANFDTIKTFPEFVERPVPGDDFSFERAFGPLVDQFGASCFADLATVEANGGLPHLMRALSLDDAAFDGVTLPPFSAEPDPDVVAVQTGLIVSRLATTYRKHIGAADRPRVAELREQLRHQLPEPSADFWGWTSELLDLHRARFFRDAKAFDALTGVAVPQPPRRTAHLPSTIDMEPRAVATLIDGAHTIVTTPAPAPPPPPPSVNRDEPASAGRRSRLVSLLRRITPPAARPLARKVLAWARRARARR